MISIKFDGLYFTILDALSAYIVDMYGSWAGVPDTHPQIAIVSALHGHNEDYYVESNGCAVQKPKDQWPPLFSNEYSDGACCHCGLNEQMWEERLCSSDTGHAYEEEPEETQAYWNRVHDAA